MNVNSSSELALLNYKDSFTPSTVGKQAAV